MRHQTTMEESERTPTSNQRWHAKHATARVSAPPATPDPAVDGRDIAAFEEMVGRCEDGAYRLAMQLVRSEAVAQEILQRTFLSAWQNRRRLVGEGQFNLWVYRSVGKAALGHLNSADRQAQASGGNCLASIRTSPRFWIRPSAGEESDWSTRPTDQLRSEDLYRHIRNVVDALPAEMRTMFILCDLDAMSIEDSAEILGLPVAAVKEHLQAARMAVRTAIGDYFCRKARDGASSAASAAAVRRLSSEASLTAP